MVDLQTRPCTNLLQMPHFHCYFPFNHISKRPGVQTGVWGLVNHVCATGGVKGRCASSSFMKECRGAGTPSFSSERPRQLGSIYLQTPAGMNNLAGYISNHLLPSLTLTPSFFSSPLLAASALLSACGQTRRTSLPEGHSGSTCLNGDAAFGCRPGAP